MRPTRRRLTRRHGLQLIGAGLAAPFVRPSWAQGGRVNVYNWADYIGETTLADFEAETGITVVYDLYASTEEMEAKLLAGSTGYDVVLQSGLGMPRMLRAGIYRPLDRARLPGWDNLDPRVLAILDGFDPGLAHSVPYMWGSVGYTFNVDMVRERLPDADLADLGTIFLPENAARLADCGISILDSPTDVMPTVLRWLGLDGDTTDIADYDRVVEAFRPIRPYIRTFDNSNYLNALPNGEICVAGTWSGDYGVAKARAAEAGIVLNLEYHVPRTGAPAWFDVWAMPADAPNIDNAYAFLAFMLRPEVIAAATNFTGYANANAAALPLVEEAIRNDPAVYPDAETMRRLWALRPMSEEQKRAMMRAWTEIKTG
jgi:putrescine transport system substrate-binding protein